MTDKPAPIGLAIVICDQIIDFLNQRYIDQQDWVI